jgi:hypothetical protein
VILAAVHRLYRSVRRECCCIQRDLQRNHHPLRAFNRTPRRASRPCGKKVHSWRSETRPKSPKRDKTILSRRFQFSCPSLKYVDRGESLVRFRVCVRAAEQLMRPRVRLPPIPHPPIELEDERQVEALKHFITLARRFVCRNTIMR